MNIQHRGRHPSPSPPTSISVQQQPRGHQPLNQGQNGISSIPDYQRGYQQVYTQQTQQQTQQYRPQFVSPAGAPHDMSKQPLTTQGTPVGGQTGPTSQPGMVQPQYMYTGMQQGTRQPFYNPQPQLSGQQMPRQRGPRPQIQYSTSPNTYAGGYNQMQAFVPGQTQMYVPNQQQMQIVSMPNVMYQATRGMAPQTQYIGNQGTTQYIPPNTPPYQYSNQQAQPGMAFFSQPNTVQQTQSGRPPSQPSAQAAPYQKREKRVLQIIDPNTNKPINLSGGEAGGTGSGPGSQNNTPPASQSSSSRGTPVSSAMSNTPPPSGTTPAPASVPPPSGAANNQSEIAAQFAAQVAATLTTQRGAGGQVTEVGKPAEADVGQQAAVATTPEQTVIVGNVEPQQVAQEVAAADVPKDVVDSSTEKEVVTQKVTEVKTAEVSVTTTAEVSVTTTAGAMDTENSVAVENTTEEIIRTSQSNEVVETPVKQEVVEEKREENVASVTGQGEPNPGVQKVEPEETVTIEEAPADASGKKSLSRKQKLQELNKKGESLQGTDMDAFTEEDRTSGSSVDPVPEVKTVTENNVDAISKTDDTKVNEVNRNITQKEENANIANKQPETVTTDIEVPQVEIAIKDKEIQEKVAEKNEINEEKNGQVKEDSVKQDGTSEPIIKQDKKGLKYAYREDQWSPLNLEGKKEYDRDFLLRLQFNNESTKKPEGLPKLPEIILDKPITAKQDKGGKSHFGLPPMHPSGVDFTPGFIKSAVSPRGSGGPGGRNRSQQRGQKEIKIIKGIIPQQLELKTTENAWKASMKKKKEADDPEKAKTEELLRKVTGILNKLTPQNFQRLVEQMMQFPIDTEERLRGTIDLIFEKAIDEPGFSVAYANMCRYLMKHNVPVESGKPGETVNFRKLLLNHCQREFEKDKDAEIAKDKKLEEIEKAETEEEKDKMKEEMELAITKQRRRSLGNIKFIGELFKLQMLTETIMHDCLLNLLKACDEESLECLCRLMTTIGKLIDHPKAKLRVDQYFQRMDQIVKGKKTSSRVRFMLQDVGELRENGWVPRRADNNPKTIDQIHREAEKEAMEKKMMLAQASQSRGRGSRDSRDRREERGQRPNQQEDPSGWSTVGATKASRIDPSKMKISKQPMDENIQLGPGGRPGFGGWGRGSSGGGSKTQSQENERPPTPGNRFSALSQTAPSASEGHDSRGRGAGRGIASSRGDSRGRTPMQARGARGSGGRVSKEEERESMLSATRNFVGAQKPASRDSSREGGSRGGSRESSKTRIEQVATPTKEIEGKELTEAEMESKCKAILDEFLHINDMKEALLCISELRSPSTMHTFVFSALNHVLERSEQARRHTGHLLHDAVKEKLLTVTDYLKGLKEILEFAEDMEIDIPKIWQYLGEMIAPMVQDGSVPLNFLKEAVQGLIANNKAGPLVAAVLHNASHRLGHIQVGEQWKSSGLRWEDFLPQGANVQEFIEKNKLEFTMSGDTHPSIAMISLEQIQEQLDLLLLNKKADNEVIMDWIESKLPEDKTKEPRFIRALMTSVCKSAIEGEGAHAVVDDKEIGRRAVLLQKYLDSKDDLELQALYALQALVHSLEHPPRMLQGFFDKLYDEDVISEEAFNQWDASTDPAEQEGKGVAQKSVVQFFTWLKNTDLESEAT